MEKYDRAGESTDDMAYAHCTRDTEGYKHTLGICSTYYFSMAKLVSQMRLIVTLRINCFVSVKFLSLIVSILHLIFFTSFVLDV